MESIQEPQIDEVREGDMEVFAKALSGELEYGAGNDSIARVEVFMMCWLNGLDYPNVHAHMTALYHRFKNVFPYTGRLFRVMSFKNEPHQEIKLEVRPVASFTDDIELAQDIRDESEGFTRYIYMTEAVQAFAMDALLAKVKEKTPCVDMEIVILDREWEQEKIHPFVPEDNDLVMMDVNGKFQFIQSERMEESA